MSRALSRSRGQSVASTLIHGAAAVVGEASRHRTRNAAGIAAWRDVLTEILGSRPLRVLVVGCGAGDVALLLYSMGHYPQGVDASPDRIRRARSVARERCAAVPFSVGDAQDLAFTAGAFDAVVAGDVLASLPRPEWALAEWFRVLRPGGAVLVVEWAPAVRAADSLRRAGFTDVVDREESLLRERGADSSPWYVRWTHSARLRRCRVAWGRRH